MGTGLQVFTTGRELATSAEHLGQTILSTIDRLDYDPSSVSPPGRSAANSAST